MNTFLIAAITQDGYLAQDVAQTSTDWTSVEDKKFFRDRTKEARVVVMGRKTFETVGRLLPGRVNIVMSRNAEIRDRSYEFSVEVLGQEINEVDNKKLYYTQLKPTDLVTKIKELGYSEFAVCGGAMVYQQFLEEGLLDTLYLTVEPVKFGSGISLFGSDEYMITMHEDDYPETLKFGDFTFTLKTKKRLNEQGTLLLEYIAVRM